MTPQEAWNGYKPNVSHLKIFGCIGYAHVPEQKRRKPDDRAEKGIFIGYEPHTKAYKVYNPVTKKLIISRDVQFQENDYWKWTPEEKSIKGLFYEDDQE